MFIESELFKRVKIKGRFIKLHIANYLVPYVCLLQPPLSSGSALGLLPSEYDSALTVSGYLFHILYIYVCVCVYLYTTVKKQLSGYPCCRQAEETVVRNLLIA